MCNDPECLITQLINKILNTEIKIKILRVFTDRQEGYQATGREVARPIGTTAPSAHAANDNMKIRVLLGFRKHRITLTAFYAR